MLGKVRLYKGNIIIFNKRKKTGTDGLRHKNVSLHQITLKLGCMSFLHTFFHYLQHYH